jgi:hypothetical protein
MLTDNSYVYIMSTEPKAHENYSNNGKVGHAHYSLVHERLLVFRRYSAPAQRPGPTYHLNPVIGNKRSPPLVRAVGVSATSVVDSTAVPCVSLRSASVRRRRTTECISHIVSGETPRIKEPRRDEVSGPEFVLRHAASPVAVRPVSAFSGRHPRSRRCLFDAVVGTLGSGT